MSIMFIRGRARKLSKDGGSEGLITANAPDLAHIQSVSRNSASSVVL